MITKEQAEKEYPMGARVNMFHPDRREFLDGTIHKHLQGKYYGNNNPDMVKMILVMFDCDSYPVSFMYSIEKEN